MALVYSTAEYCSPVWARSSRCGRLDTELNQSIRTITGTERSTPVPWLHVLSNIAPPSIRREQATTKLTKSIKDNPALPAYSYITRPPRVRLKSRRPIWSVEEKSHSAEDEWRPLWTNSEVVNSDLIRQPIVRVPSFDLPRRAWVQLNRVRTNMGCCNYLLWKWGRRESPACDCGAEEQAIRHIVEECSLRRFSGALRDIHEAKEEAVDWLRGLDVRL